MSPTSSQSRQVPDITLAEVPALAGELAARVRGGGFNPDLIVYIETGARLLAWELCREFGIGAVAVEARRRGHGLKQRLAGIIARLPAAVTSALRRMEERSGIHGATGRSVVFPATVSFSNRAILLVDDAADTGVTIAVVKAGLVRRGADASDVRTAVLTATTPAARAQVDYFLREQNSRLPWSADSRERDAVLARFAECRPPAP